MRREIINAVLERSGYRCAWCSCKLNTGKTADRGIVCKLDASESDDKLVASCVACNAEFMKWRRWGSWSVAVAVQHLGRVPGTMSAPFVDYLEAVTDDRYAFHRALGAIEAQRNEDLGLVRKSRAA